MPWAVDPGSIPESTRAGALAPDRRPAWASAARASALRALNGRRAVPLENAGPTAQLLIERISDSQYDPTRVGEVYLTDFTGQGILGTPTTDRSGTLRLQRIGDTVEGAYRDGTGWAVIGTYALPGEGAVPRTMGFGIFGGQPVTPGVRVAFDNFYLDAASLTVPEPASAALWLFGLGAVALARRRVCQSLKSRSMSGGARSLKRCAR